MKTSALRTWLRRERAREYEAWLDRGEPLPPMVCHYDPPGEESFFDDHPMEHAPFFSNIPVATLSVEGIQSMIADLERLKGSRINPSVLMPRGIVPPWLWDELLAAGKIDKNGNWT